MPRPTRRSKYRFLAGRFYYTVRRYLQWHLGRSDWADMRGDSLEYTVFEHRTPLIRPLPNHAMWMQRNKIKNLEIATRALDGVILGPGQTLSFWRRIGRPTRRRGYVEGMVLQDGDVVPGIGGGLCQLSNLIYWMTLHTPLTVVERHRHSYDAFPDSDRTQPFGSGATCAYPYVDLQICNNTTESYQIRVHLIEASLVGQWRAEREPLHTYRVYEKDHWITHETWGGYVRHNVIHREVFNKEGTRVDDEYVTENHAIMMYQPLLDCARDPRQ